MRLRDLLLIIGAMACFTAAIAIVLLLQMETQERSEANVETICRKLERIDGEPCQLIQPSDHQRRVFAFLRRE